MIFLGIIFLMPASANQPLNDIENKINNDINNGSNLSGSEGEVSSPEEVQSNNSTGFLSKIGSGITSGFGKVKDVLGLSPNDIKDRKIARAKKKAENEQAKADATAEERGMLDAAVTVGGQFDDHIDEILESDEITDPSAELNNAEETYREKIEILTDGKSGKTVKLIKEDMEASIMEARNLINKNPDKLKEFRDNATSVNRTNMMDKAVTSVSTAAMGIGGMQLAQGLAEQSADKKATSEMQGYLSNLYCAYSNKQAKYGVKDIKIDDENKLDLLREEFLTKAAQLKYTKEQLGLKAGLESQVVFDEKTTALYENQGTNRASSKFGRMSEALMNESGTDAQILAEQQKKSQNRVTGGAIAVVGGAAAAIGGHALINKFGATDKSGAIGGTNQETNNVADEGTGSDVEEEEYQETTPNSGSNIKKESDSESNNSVFKYGNTTGLGGTKAPLSDASLGVKLNTTPTTTPLLFNNGTSSSIISNSNSKINFEPKVLK